MVAKIIHTFFVLFLILQIMQAVVLILESDNMADVKEQAICILANIADGDAARSFIMSNEVGSLMLLRRGSFIHFDFDNAGNQILKCVDRVSF